MRFFDEFVLNINEFLMWCVFKLWPIFLRTFENYYLNNNSVFHRSIDI